VVVVEGRMLDTTTACLDPSMLTWHSMTHDPHPRGHTSHDQSSRPFLVRFIKSTPLFRFDEILFDLFQFLCDDSLARLKKHLESSGLPLLVWARFLPNTKLKCHRICFQGLLGHKSGFSQAQAYFRRASSPSPPHRIPS